MNTRIVSTILCSIGGLAPVLAGAQAVAADVTFEIPLNLTRLHADITHVKVLCTIDSRQLKGFLVDGAVHRTRSAETILPVTNGTVSQTVRVVVPLTEDDFSYPPSGEQANYDCSLNAKSTNSSRWREFASAQGGPEFALTPAPARMTGAFVW